MDHKEAPIFNLADKQDTDQETVNTYLWAIFGIEMGYHGNVVSTFAKMKLNSVLEGIYEKHLQPRADILKDNQVQNSPLSPYLDPELLYNNAISINGAAIEEQSGFKYAIPFLTQDNLQETIDQFKEMGL
ncbi:unnamed protein product [Absidia cylindrospora]